LKLTPLLDALVLSKTYVRRKTIRFVTYTTYVILMMVSFYESV